VPTRPSTNGDRTSNVVVSLHPLFPTPSTSSTIAMRTPENTEEVPEPADEGDVQMEYSSD
jgi:hypothetical protein